MHTHQIGQRAARQGDWAMVGLGGAALTAVLFVAARGGWGLPVLGAAAAVGLAACAMYYAVRGLIGGRLARQVTLWLTLALVVMVLSPLIALQAYAGLAVVGLWTLCLAFGELLA